MTRLFWLVAASAVMALLVLALEPTAASAAVGSSRVARPGAGVVLLARGDGYDSPGGSARVRALQRLLARAGDTPGPIDGRYGPLTEHAVRRFQATNGLQVDGMAGPQTITHLHPKTTTNPRTSTRARPRPARQDASQRPPARAQAPRNVGRAHPSGSTSTGWLVLLGALVLGLGLLLITRRRRASRDSDRESSAQEAGLEQHPNLGVLPEAQSNQDSAEAASGALNLGLLLESRDDLVGAEEAYRHADQRGDAKGALNLGFLLGERGDLVGPEEAYGRADRRGDAIGAFNLGVRLESRDDLVGAEEAYRRAEQRGNADEAGIGPLGILSG